MVFGTAGPTPSFSIRYMSKLTSSSSVAAGLGEEKPAWFLFGLLFFIEFATSQRIDEDDAAEVAPEEDVLNPPAPCPSKKNEPQNWVCPECGFSTGVRKDWVKIRRTHVVTWHADKKDYYNRHRIADLIPWDPNLCSWKCPLCNSGVPRTVSNKDVQYKMRLAHRDRCHPKARREQFLRARGNIANARRATIAKTSAGLARKMVDLKAGEQGEHECEILQLPYVGKGKAVRRFHNQLFCKKCKYLACSARLMSRVRCDASFGGGPSEGSWSPSCNSLLRNLAMVLLSKSQPSKSSRRFLRLTMWMSWPLQTTTWSPSRCLASRSNRLTFALSVVACLPAGSI